MGFLLDEVINPNGEFWADHKVSIGALDPDKVSSDEEEDNMPEKKKR